MTKDRARKLVEAGVLILGLVVFLAGIPHGFLGWPTLKAALVEAGVGADVTAAAGAGWWFGSSCMFGLGALVLLSFRELRRGNAFGRDVCAVVGLTYLAFGLGATITAGGGSHFAFFMGLGALLLLCAGLWKPAAEPSP